MQIRSALQSYERASRQAQAMNLVRQVFFSEFENEIYAHPEVDYEDLWARLHQQYFGVRLGPDTAAWDVEHYVSSPVYIQNYAIGIIMVEQLYKSIQTEFKTRDQTVAIGTKLKRKYFAPGSEYDYLELTQRFTGEPLSANAALDLLKDVQL